MFSVTLQQIRTYADLVHALVAKKQELYFGVHVCVTPVTFIHTYNFTSSHELSIVFSHLSRARRGGKTIGRE